MKRGRIEDLASGEASHILGDLVGGKRLGVGGYHRFKPGEVAHAGEKHIHDTDEVFLILQGRARLPIEGRPTAELVAGDIAVVEPGEDHHLTGDETDPAVLVWFHVED